ncbi:uncharacterized protein LOC100141881 [Tribolium castaneum]|uniref:DUF4200 domain-containing protein n=1 Tax=Tribolium castaneum TaxID=7070 RepID=D2CG23_TRICA|nr:PREDICTED: uncharacterized protein LOC100141881 [Tribolium castaneum]EFA12335.2 hypothetical protein TcasGA2_TC010231 [Tribolium castaneum]|eukprot:XP_008197170.1 PREDICTED: uncharacterized protein LOC100141881 [Tribolium castaneum]
MWPSVTHPEKSIGDYTISKQQVQPEKYWPLLIGPDITLRRFRSKLLQREQQLENKRQKYLEYRVELDAKWAEIEAEGKMLRSNFNAFNNFLIINAEKRKRTIETIADLKQNIVKRENDIEELHSKIEFMKASKVELEREISSHLIFEKYLNSFLDICHQKDGLRSPHNILERYEYFTEINKHLAERQQELFIKLQTSKLELSRFREVNETILLGLHTQAAGLQGRFEEAVRKSRQLETLIATIKQRARDIYKDMSFTKKAVWNLYLLMCKKKGLPIRLRKYEVEQQLIFISKTLKQFEKLIEWYKMQQKMSVRLRNIKRLTKK